MALNNLQDASGPATSSPFSDNQMTSEQFFAKVSEYAEAIAAARKYHDEVFWPAHEAWQAECEKIPHVTLEPDPYSGKTHPLSTANFADVLDAKGWVLAGTRVDPIPSLVAHAKLMHRLYDASQQREHAKRRLSALLRVDEYFHRHEDMESAASELFNELIESPAPDQAALAWKLERLWGDEPGAGYCEEWTQAIVADSRRLLS